jgi:hypothetical protein
MVLAPQQQQYTPAPSTSHMVSPWGTRAPVKPDAPAKPHTIGTHQPPVSEAGVCLWFWQQHVDCEVKRLEEVLVARMGSNVALHRELCKHSMLSPNSFAKHVARDFGHIAQVQARFEHEGPSWRGWVQCWDGVAQLNHLTLEVCIAELSASGGGSEVTTTTCSGTALISSCVCSPVEQLCVAVRQVTVASGDEEKQQVPRIVPGAALLSEAFLDPDSGHIWRLNSQTGEVLWSKPEDMESCGPNMSPKDISGDGGQQHASHTAALSAGTGGEPTTTTFCC